jgi:hypothetical protein
MYISVNIYDSNDNLAKPSLRFTHSIVCLATDPNRVLHWVRSSFSSFKFQYPFLSLRSFKSCLHLLSLLPFPSIFLSITWFRRQFLRKIWPTQLALFLIIVCRIFFPPWSLVTLLHFSHDQFFWSSPAFSSTTFRNFPRNPQGRIFKTLVAKCQTPRRLNTESRNLTTTFFKCEGVNNSNSESVGSFEDSYSV